MEIIRGLCNLSNHFNHCVITLGNFDGVHLGHQVLISRLKQVGKEKKLPTVVMLFEPQPLEFFCLDNAPARLTSFREKYGYIRSLGVDYLLVIPFNKTFADMSAQIFIEQGLINRLGAQYVIVGDDFRFGSKRQGNIEQLKHYAQRDDFKLEVMPSYIEKKQRVSSTAIRRALDADDFSLANSMLGRNYSIQGYVVHGNQLARQLGFPTANIHLNRKKPALHGVYFVKIDDICSSQSYFGIANIGIRPTINGKTAILEVNIFDFNQNIYGHYLDVQFVKKIRNEVKFESLIALKTQIAQDISIAKQIKEEF